MRKPASLIALLIPLLLSLTSFSGCTAQDAILTNRSNHQGTGSAVKKIENESAGQVRSKAVDGRDRIGSAEIGEPVQVQDDVYVTVTMKTIPNVGDQDPKDLYSPNAKTTVEFAVNIKNLSDYTTVMWGFISPEAALNGDNEKTEITSRGPKLSVPGFVAPSGTRTPSYSEILPGSQQTYTLLTGGDSKGKLSVFIVDYSDRSAPRLAASYSEEE